MQKSVLVEIIRALTPKEIRATRKWLRSPAHNQREDAVNLFEYLVKNLEEAEEVLSKERVWKNIFPKEPFSDARIRQTMHFLLDSIEEFLAFEEWSSNPVRVKSDLLKVYRHRKLERPFRQMMDTARREQEQSPHRDSNYLKEKFSLDFELSEFLSVQKWDMDVKFQETSDALDIAYIAEKLQVGCMIISHQNKYKKINYDLGLLEPVVHYVEQKNLLEYPTIAIYYYQYKSLTDRENEAHFESLEKYLIERGGILPVEDLRESYYVALNYCIGRLNLGKVAYARKAFDIYKNGFEMAILIENGTISKAAFLNAVSAALRVEEHNWAENFIDKFQIYLDEKHKDSTVFFNLARLHIAKGDYDKAQRLLAGFDYDDILLNILAKIMLLKIYYEQDELDAYESLTESIRTYIQRKDALSPNHRIVFKNTLSIMKKLLNLNPYSKAQVEKFREAVMETNPLQEREWFLAQISDEKRGRR